MADTDSLYASAVLDQKTAEVIVKLVNVSGKPVHRTILLDGTKKLKPAATLTLLTTDKLEAVNTFENATAVSPVKRPLPVDVRKKAVTVTLGPHSLSVIRIPVY